MTFKVPELRVCQVPRSRLPAVDLNDIPFSSVFSDHMFTARCCHGTWQDLTIQAYGPLSLQPSISALQYGISVFEGLKAHRTPTGEVAIFRPNDNARRLNLSAARLAMPSVPEELFMAGLQKLLETDRAWVPPSGNGALYIRPCFFSIDASVRVKPAEEYLFVIFTFPFGAYYSATVDALVSDRYTRAFPGGTGDVKPAGNYAPTLLADREALDAGMQTVIWLDAEERKYVEECGVMNVFFVIDGEVVTPPLSGTILAGITRDSALVILRKLGWKVRERRVSIHELLAAHDRGTLHECFGTGTAATLTHVRRIRYRDRELELPPVERRAVGPMVLERLTAIAAGRADDTHGWLHYA